MKEVKTGSELGAPKRKRAVNVVRARANFLEHLRKVGFKGDLEEHTHVSFHDPNATEEQIANRQHIKVFSLEDEGGIRNATKLLLDLKKVVGKEGAHFEPTPGGGSEAHNPLHFYGSPEHAELEASIYVENLASVKALANMKDAPVPELIKKLRAEELEAEKFNRAALLDLQEGTPKEQAALRKKFRITPEQEAMLRKRYHIEK